MTNDLDEATEDAKRLATTIQQATPADTSPDQRESVYILEGCDCREQGGLGYRYHIHRFTPAGYFGWHALHEDKVVAQYPS